MSFRRFDRLVITKHALQQFKQRNPSVIDPLIINDRILTYLGRTEVEKRNSSSKKTQKRHIRNSDCIYYIYNGWRFVIRQSNGSFILVTCERTQPIQNSPGYWEMRRIERSGLASAS